MNPEHPEREPSKKPERRAFHTPPGAEAEHTVRRVLERLTSIDDELRIVDAFLTHGAGFAAYLHLNDTRPDDPNIAEKYEAVYADAWDSLDDLATDTIEALGWREGLTEFMTTAGIPENYLTWNLTEAHGHLHDMYDFVELDRLTHAFHK
jgi:hypothetical protein